MAANVVSTLHSDDACHCVKIMREPKGAFATPQQAVAASDGMAWLAEKQKKSL